MINEPIIHPIKGRILIEELDESEALLILTSVGNLGAVKVRFLIHHFGSALQALLATPEEISKFAGFGSKILTSWARWPIDESWKRNLLLVAKCGVTLLPYTSQHYPKRLLEIADAPVLLYVKGTLIPADQRSIAIIGTRQASIYGLEMAKKFASELTAFGFTIVSGLARGVDTAAHQGALERGRTLAVIGSGLADIYPGENRALAERLSGQGALISEFPMETPPDRQNFPQRNRIVSGITLGTLLIEAPLKSGAMITMEKGIEQGRSLFALPGRIDNDNFRGNHHLIKKGKALLVETGAEIAAYLDGLFGDFHPLPTAAKPASSIIPLDKEEERVLRCFPSQELSVEEIFAFAKISISALNVLLMKLVLKGYLKEFPGKVYKKIGIANNG
ncbi:MAG: DNA-protecting protein DprA [Parachlamydiaceae bacterium]|nr:DNA-protecting protein DprA [Parachlamydiaceae bacterium]